MKKTFSLAAFIFVLLSSSSGAADFRFFARSGVYPFSGLDLSLPSDDLKPIDQWTAGAKIVGLGESAHSVGGYQKARNRVVKRMVTELGFRTIMIEDDYVGTETVETYLDECHAGLGDDASFTRALKSLDSGIHQTAEMAELLRWSCEWNRNHPLERLHFHGLDIWENPWKNREILEAAAVKVGDAAFTADVATAKANCFAWSVNNWTDAAKLPEWDILLKTWRLDPARTALCQGTIYNIETRYYQNQAVFDAKLGPKDSLLVSMAIRVGETYERYRDFYVFELPKALTLRDATQAWLALNWMDFDGPTTKAVSLIHNLHISKKQSVVMTKLPSRTQWKDARSTGENLRAYFGEGYRSIAISGYDVTSRTAGKYPLPISERSLDLELSKQGDFLLVDTGASWITQGKDWWMHLEGAVNGSFLLPEEQYDGIVFLREAAAATKWVPPTLPAPAPLR